MYTVIIPCYNEEKTVKNILKTAISAKNVGQVLLINDGSTDRTVERSSGISPLIEIVSHQRNMGKGMAVRTGIAHAKYESVVFIDADLTNLTGENVYALVEPLINDQADFVKASFTRARGRVTEIAIKPMMQILFPDTYFDQPISGQFAGKLSFLKNIRITEDWGLDIGILLDAVSHNLRIKEVFIGELEHKAQSDTALAKMSEQVMRTMIQKAGLHSNRYRLILFSFDETLLQNYSMGGLMAYLGKKAEFEGLDQRNADESILPIEYYQELAELMQGVAVSDVAGYVSTLKLRTYASDLITHLTRRNYKVGIIGLHFSPIMEAVAQRLKISIVEGIELPRSGKKYAGRMSRQSILRWFDGTIEDGYRASMHKAVRAADTSAENTIAVVSSQEGIPLLEEAGLGISYRSKSREVRQASNKNISILPELLMLVE